MTTVGSLSKTAPGRVRAVAGRLRWLRWRPETALVVPVPTAGPLLARARGEVARSDDLGPHITVLYPFLALPRIDEQTMTALAGIARHLEPFRFHLNAVRRFPTAVYLAPEPAAPFIAMMEAIAARWRECRPYRGRHQAFIPHLTVATSPEPPGLMPVLRRLLPLECTADQIDLVVQADTGRWVTHSPISFRLGRGR